MKFGIFFIFSLFFAASFKNDGGAVVNSSDWSSLAIFPYFEILKNYSYVGFIFSGIFGFILISRNNSIYFSNSRELLLLFFVLFIAAFRSIAFDGAWGIKFLIAFFIFLFCCVISIQLIKHFGFNGFSKIFKKSLLLMSVVFISVNLANELLGFGYVVGVPRYFGITSHPNFLGVQMALFCIILITSINLSLIGFFYFASFVAGFLVLFFSGSRTGFLMLGVGALAYLQLIPNIKYKKLILLGSMAVLVWIYAGLNDEDLLVFDRGSTGADTRSSAWILLLEAFLSSPYFGVGFFSGASESSYLKMFALYGIFYGLAYLTLILIVLKNIFKSTKKYIFLNSELYFSLLLALLVGGFFEGYLVDAFSVPVLLLFFLILISAYSKVRYI